MRRCDNFSQSDCIPMTMTVVEGTGGQPHAAPTFVATVALFGKRVCPGEHLHARWRRKLYYGRKSLHSGRLDENNPSNLSCATACASARLLPKNLDRICERIAGQDSEVSRLLAVIKLADSATFVRSEECSPETRVPGCAAVVHVTVESHPEDPTRIIVNGAADAQVARGLLALFMHGLNGATFEDVLAVKADDVVSASSLKISWASSRVLGLRNILKAVQDRTAGLLHRRMSGGGNQLSSQWAAREACERSVQHYTSKQAEDVAVLLSGGVDSSVALRLVQESGVRPHPFYLKIWLEDELAHLGQCPWEEDLGYASAVCEQVGLSVEPVPLQSEYWDRVVSYTLAEARAGRTPNPDIMCNSRVKFGAFYDVIGNQFSQVVTGHYANTRVTESGRTQLTTSADSLKDQTYFLSHLQQEQIGKARFPVGQFCKNEVRELARAFDLPNRERKDSQGICFLGKIKFDEFLMHHLGTERGPLVEFETGVEVGVHRGFWFYTLGQRKGLGLSGGPWYVTAKDPVGNIVYVSRHYDDSDKARNEFDFDNASWISGSWPAGLEQCGKASKFTVKTRHGPRCTECIVTRTGRHSGHVLLASRDIGLAPGQFAAFYSGDVCLGSGTITTEREQYRPPSAHGSTSNVQYQSHYADA